MQANLISLDASLLQPSAEVESPYILEGTIEDMSVRKETKEEIASQVSVQLSVAIESLKPKGLRKIAHVIRDWGGVAAVIGANLALVAIVVMMGIDVFSRREQNARFQKGVEDFQTQTNDHLNKMEERLTRLEVPAKLRSLATLGPMGFSSSLQTLKKIVELPPKEITADPDNLRTIAAKLRITPDSTPNYWPTVLQFIQFASSILALPSDVPPPGSPYSYIGNNTCPGTMKHCILASHRTLILDGGDIPNSRFEKCRIIFTMKPVKMRNVEFIDCVFEMPVIATPNEYLKSMSQTLLASNLQDVSILTFPSTHD